MNNNDWVGVDLDGTLAEYHGWKGPSDIGQPIPLMLERVKNWIEAGIIVKILTARVSSNNSGREEAILAIKQWCLEHIGVELEVTAEKDYNMIELWDDRCIQVEFNTGKRVGVLCYDFLTQVHPTS